MSQAHPLNGLIRSLPKVELHLHLDACARPATLRELAVERGLPPPTDDEVIAPPICVDLRDYIDRVDRALELMQDAAALTRIARELVEDLADDRVIYAEVRYAPQLSMRQGLTMQAVVDAVAEGLAQGEAATGVRTRTILCTLRHEASEVSEAVAEVALANRQRAQVVALDLAGDEARHDASSHARAFDLARRGGLHRTVHAGEAAGPASMEDALRVLGAERIGHGVRVTGDMALVRRIALEGVPLEMCPTSNVQTRAVANMADHPADAMLRAGVRVTISCDGRTTTPTTLSDEWLLMARQFGWGVDEFAAVTRHALDAAFVPDAERERLIARVAHHWPGGL